MSFELSVLGQRILFEPPPHSCSERCGDLCTAYEDVNATECQIRETLGDLEKTFGRYLEFRTKMNTIHDPLTTRLPPEISASIFELCLPRWKRTTKLGFREADNASVLFTLGAVCKTWRHIIWSTPSFWSHLLVLIGPSTVLSYTPLVEEWLARSGDVLLSIAVYFKDQDEYCSGYHDWFTPLGKIVNATSSRWDCLDLELPISLRSFFQVLPCHLRELRMVNWGLNSRTREDAFGSLTTTAGSNLPAPTCVCLSFVALRTVPILWNNVTEASIAGLTIVECLELLRLAPALESCFIPDALPVQNFGGAVPFVHANLKELKIQFPEPNGFVHKLCDAITLPKLQKLLIHHNEFEFLPMENLIALIERSGCALDDVEVLCKLKDDDLIAFLKAIPSLRHLSFGESGPFGQFTTNNIFKKIAQTSHIGKHDPASTPSPERFVPHLESLKYLAIRPDDCKRIWDVIPSLYGISSHCYDLEDMGPHRRPLDDVKILYVEWQREPGLDPALMGEPPTRRVPFIKKRTIAKIQYLSEFVDLHIWAHYKVHDHYEDFIEFSSSTYDWDSDEDLEYTLSDDDDDEDDEDGEEEV